MWETFDKLNFTGAPNLFVLVLLIFLGCLVSASGQDFSTREIIELVEMNVLQMNNPDGKHPGTDKPGGWILSDGNASLVVQEGNRNQALIEQVRGVGNVAKVLQQGHNNRVGYECTDKKERGIYQSGSRNYAEIEQFGNQNESVMFQYGNHNEINIAQHGGTGFFIDYGARNKSVVRQTGDGNSATVTQTFYP